jgi:hypothetical protein
LKILSKVEGLKILSKVEGLKILSKVEGSEVRSLVRPYTVTLTPDTIFSFASLSCISGSRGWLVSFDIAF